MNQQIAIAVLLQLGKDLIDKNGFLVETIDRTSPQGKLVKADRFEEDHALYFKFYR